MRTVFRGGGSSPPLGGAQAELREDLADGGGLATGCLAVCWHGEQLPDAIQVTRSPGAVIHELELEEPIQGVIEFPAVQAEHQGHSVASVEGGSLPIGSQGEEEQRSGGLGSQAAEPALMQQACVEPAESALGLSDELWPGREGTRAGHFGLRPGRGSLACPFPERSLARRASRSLASLSR